MFVGRESELNSLMNYYNKSSSQIVVVYGQKGIGKTSLLKHFCQGKESIYYNCRACSIREQYYLMGREWSNQGRNIASNYPSIEQLFDAIYTGDSQKKVIVFDEFHHLIKGDSNFISYISKIAKEKSMLVILSTSASGWVENSMVKKIGSSALNINGLLKIRELKFQDILKIYPEYDRENAIKNFSVLGGICGLWNCFSSDLSFEENIIRNVISKNSKLFGVMDIYLYEELREPSVYSTILACLAGGLNKLNDMYIHTGFSRAKISVYLKNLMELDMVSKVYSFESAGYSDTQKGIYRISNPFIKFYFKFLYPNFTELELMDEKTFYDFFIKEALNLFLDETYVKICKEYFLMEYSNISEWVGKSGTIDIVATDEDGKILVANCNYNKIMDLDDFEWLKFCAKKAKIKNPVYCLCSQKGFSDDIKKLELNSKIITKKI